MSLEFSLALLFLKENLLALAQGLPGAARWTFAHDLGLLLGVLRYGYDKYSSIGTDPELCRFVQLAANAPKERWFQLAAENLSKMSMVKSKLGPERKSTTPKCMSKSSWLDGFETNTLDSRLRRFWRYSARTLSRCIFGDYANIEHWTLWQVLPP